MNCAINEVTGDGVHVGRCWHTLSDSGSCPRHGDVSEVQKHFDLTGELTSELEHPVDIRVKV